MKRRVTWMLIPAVALGLGACGKKEEAKAPETTTPPAAETAPKPGESGSAATEAVRAPALSAEERAAKLGFAKHLPQDTEVVISFHNGSKTVDRIQASKLWQVIQSEMGAGMMGEGRDMELEGEEMEEDFELPEGEQDADAEAVEEEIVEPMGPAKLFGTEFTLAVGKSGSAQTANLLTINRRMGYFQMRGLAKVFVDAVKSGDFSDFETAIDDQFGEQLAKDLLNDSESGAALFEKMGMPPLYLAFRTTPEDRESAAQQLAALAENLGMLGDVVETVEVEKAGAKFAGQKIVGAKVAKLMEESRGEMEGIIDTDSMDKLIASAAKKDLVILSGSLGDYAVLFIGGSENDMNLTADLGQSLVTGDSLAFCDSYVSKDLAAVILGRKEMLNALTLTAGGLADFTEGLRDGIAGSDALGDTRDLEALLRLVGERESALRKLASNETLGMTAFFEDGLKIETHGGTDNGALDWKTPNRMTSLGDSEDVVLFANMTTEAAYDEAMRGYLEALMETGYAIAMQVAEAPGAAEELTEFREMTKIFNDRFREDVVAFWKAFSGDYDDGLGNEGALVMDLKGSMPPIPGVPQAVVDEAKFPRITMIAPVTDRAKLKESWQKMNSSITNVLGKVSELSGQDIPMQKPISSDKNGFTTWFFSMPFFNDDFLPSVTVGDQWFAASSSKVHALDLIDKASQAKAEKTGLFFTVNFKALQTYAKETSRTLEKNADAMSVSKDSLEKFNRTIDAMDEIDKLTIHARRENGELRTSVHFGTK